MSEAGENIFIKIYSEAIVVSRELKQTIGECHDYYITLEQLEEILMKVEKL